jgi:UDP-N-acetylmuramate dehydrogenase
VTAPHPGTPRLADVLLDRLGPAAAGRLFRDEPMSTRTTFRVGGPADLLLSPASAEEISLACALCREQGVPLTLLGNGSNVVVSDRGIRGLVVALGDDFARIGPSPDDADPCLLTAEAGARLASLAAAATRRSLSGMEALSGIPGSVGGGVYMNAGAYECCLADVVVRTDYLDEEGRLRTAVGEGHGFGYRRSLFMDRRYIVARTTVRLREDDPARISARVADFAQRRRTSQPLEMPSAGSVFRRPPGAYAGRLIEEGGFKGFRIGGAQVSPKHAGFIVNTGDATAEDIRRLMETVREEVARRTGFLLEPEILLIGEW